MDLTTTIIGAIILALCIIPLVISHNKRKSRERKLMQSLLNNAASQSGTITKHDIWPNGAIGIDETENHIYFLKKYSGEDRHQQVNLNNIRSVTISGEEGAETEKLELVLEHIGEPKIALEFYNMKTSLQINEELQLIKKWQAIVNSRLN